MLQPSTTRTLRFQKTLKSRISCIGLGLHSGRRVKMTIGPAAINSGIVFRRTDIGGMGAAIAARWSQVVDTRLCTVLGNAEGVTIGTVEHLMAAFAGAGIDNAVVEIDGAEVPIMDGSAASFVFLIECAGVAQQSAFGKRVKVLKRVTVGTDRASASLIPASVASIDFALDFANPAIGRQEKSLILGPGAIKGELSRARTFGFAEEVEHLRKAGLARGGSLDNAIVIGENRVLNREGLRYGDEFVRHKMLDAVGDLYLAGAPIEGRFHGVLSGHSLNNRLLRTFFSDRSAWALIEDDGEETSWAEDDFRQASA